MFFSTLSWHGYSLSSIILSIIAGLGFGVIVAKFYRKTIGKMGLTIGTILLLLSPIIGVDVRLIQIDQFMVRANIFIFISILSFALVKLIRAEIRSD